MGCYTKLMVFPVVFSFALLGSIRAASARSAQDLRTLTVESPLQVHDLEAAQDALEEVDRQQLEVLNTLAEEFSAFLDTMQEVGAAVAEATNAWVANPTPETEAAVTLAIAQGAEKGHTAAQAVTALKGKLAHATQVLQDQLQLHLQETRSAARRARRQAARFAAAHQHLRNAAREAKHLLEAKGYTATSSLPPELADSVSRLEMEYSESAMLAEIQRELGPLLDDYVSVLEQAEHDYERIHQLARLVTDQAGSVGRVLSQLGAVEAQKIQVKLNADVFAKSAGLREHLTTVAGRLYQARRNIHRLITASRRLPQLDRSEQSQTADHAQTNRAFDWLWSLDDASDQRGQ